MASVGDVPGPRPRNVSGDLARPKARRPGISIPEIPGGARAPAMARPISLKESLKTPSRPVNRARADKVATPGANRPVWVGGKFFLSCGMTARAAIPQNTTEKVAKTF